MPTVNNELYDGEKIVTVILIYRLFICIYIVLFVCINQCKCPSYLFKILRVISNKIFFRFLDKYQKLFALE
jgi:hypothetical protein